LRFLLTGDAIALVIEMENPMTMLKPVSNYLYPTIMVCLLSLIFFQNHPALSLGSTVSAKNSGMNIAPTIQQATNPAVSYTITDLGTVRDSPYIEPLDINNSGEVVGFYRLFPTDENGYPRISRHAFLYSNGVFQDLEVLIGVPFSSETDSFAYGINDSGAVVGYYIDFSSGLSPQNAFLYKDGVATDLGSFGGYQSVAFAINNNGQIIGNTTTNDGTEAMFRTFPYSPMNIATDNVGQGVAYGINDLGQIVGECSGGAFRTAPNSPLNQSTDIIIPIIINVGNARARSVNNAGQVVGETGNGIAFLYDNGDIISIATGRAYDINNFGEIVGDAGESPFGPFIYDRVNGIRYLNSLIPADSGWELLRAKAINDHGQIVGFGDTGYGRRGYLLTPNFSTPTGADITVQSNLVNITYADVSAEGTTSFAPISPDSAGTLPGGYELTGIPNTAYEISTTATITGPITIGFQVPSVTDQAVFDSLRVLHNENGELIDRTVLPPDSPAPDFASRTIYARVDSLSPFVIARLANGSPTVNAINGPVDPVQVNEAISFSAGFTDSGTSDTHTALWNWGDGYTSPGIVTETGGSGSVNGTHIYTAAGVYTVTLAVTDNNGSSGEAVSQFIVIYNPNGGFVTGGGWIDSPVGAYVPNLSLTGKANFGFVSKYQNGASVPTGNTEFQFKAAGLNFKSTSYEWMVIAGKKAQYKGFGTINGQGSYRFMLTVIDGQQPGGDGQDKFRIRIWSDGSGLVYDNQLDAPDTDDPTTVLGGGSIVIHKP
jgi:probable HAF family extracellular repeat protein